MGLLSKDDILTADDLKREIIEVPEWGGSVCIGEMTGTRRDKYESDLFSMRNDNVELTDLRAKLVAQSIIDPSTGELMFSQGEVKALGQKAFRALDRVYAVAERLNSLTTLDAEEDAKNS